MVPGGGVLAIDKDAIVNRLLPEGTATKVASHLDAAALGFDPNLKPYGYDPKRAQQALEENNYDGRAVVLWSAPLAASPETPEIMQLVQGYLEAVGLKVDLRPISRAQLAPMFRRLPQRLPTDVACNIYVNVLSPRPLVMENIANSWISIEAGGRHGGYWDSTYIDGRLKEAPADHQPRQAQGGAAQAQPQELQRVCLLSHRGSRRDLRGGIPGQGLAARQVRQCLAPRDGQAEVARVPS